MPSSSFLIRLYRFLDNNKVWLIYVPLTVYWIILFILTSIPGNQITTFGVSDKIKHAGAYFVLTIFLFLTLHFQNKYPKLKTNAGIAALIISLIYGVIDEVHQLFIPGRSGDMYDWLADLLGTIIAVAVVQYVVKISKNAADTV